MLSRSARPAGRRHPRHDRNATHVLAGSAGPGLVDTGASHPWFAGMSRALPPADAAADLLWLATLPPGTREPYGEVVQHRKVLPFNQRSGTSTREPVTQPGKVNSNPAATSPEPPFGCGIEARPVAAQISAERRECARLSANLVGAGLSSPGCGPIGR
jgi:hypothetical protein